MTDPHRPPPSPPAPPGAPVLLTLHPENIPEALRKLGRYTVWRHKVDPQAAGGKGKLLKLPYRIKTPKQVASSRQAAHWGTFDEAVALWRASQGTPEAFDGIGFTVYGQSELWCLDFDGCRDPVTGAIAAEVLLWVKRCNTYTEVSPSGKGLRVVGLGTWTCDWTNLASDPKVECYCGHGGRYLTLTGHVVTVAGLDLTDLRAVDPAVIAGIYAELGGRGGNVIGSPEAHAFEVPEVLDALLLPDVATLNINERARALLLEGDEGGDGSGALINAAVSLFAAGLDRQAVFSVLVNNPHSWAIAYRKRDDDPDRAFNYLWRDQVIKAEARGVAARVTADEFDDLTVGPGGVALVETPPLPAFSRDKQGRIEATVGNLLVALARRELCGMIIGYDTFKDEIMFARKPGEWQRFRDTHYVDLRETLERGGFKPISRELIRDTVANIAERNAFDSALIWLEGLKWDGKPRVERFWIDYFGGEDTPYTRAAARYTWTALAGRVLCPGVKADMVPILVGPQGVGKSSGIAAMVPSPEFFTEVSFHEKDDDLARKMRGKLIAELAELRGLRTRELEGIKAFITRQYEHWVPKFKEFSAAYARRIVFLGSTNQGQFLADETGNRRWLPIKVLKALIELIHRDRDQLWAEAAALFTVGGVEWVAAENLAADAHEEHTVDELWMADIAAWLDAPELGELAQDGEAKTPRMRKFLHTSQIAEHALGLRGFSKNDEAARRIGRAMRRLGYTYSNQRDGPNKEQQKAWRRA